MSRTEKGVAEYHLLTDAVRDTPTPCRNDPRFIQERDQIDSSDLLAMKRVCLQCPLLALCGTYAEAARPSAGMWAGRFWGRTERTRA